MLLQDHFKTRVLLMDSRDLVVEVACSVSGKRDKLSEALKRPLLRNAAADLISTRVPRLFL